jgi:hypothetical protein
MWYLCPVTLPYIQDGCHGLWSIEKLEIFENLLLYNHSMEWNQIWSNLKLLFFIKSIFVFAYDLRSPGYSWGLHTFNTHKTILHITIHIPEAYIYLIHTKQYDTLQCTVKLQSLELWSVEHYGRLELIWKSRQFSLYF